MTNTLRVAGAIFIGWIAPALAQAEEVILPAGSQLHVVLETTLSTKDSKVGDSFRARTAFSVFANEREVIPAGTVVEGTVVNLKAPGRVAGQPEMRLRPDSLILPDGRRVLLTASVTDAQTGDNIEVDPEEGTITRSGKEGIDKGSLATGSATGAVLGGIMGGGEGALIGAGAVGAITLFHYLFKRGKDAVLPAGSELVLELNREFSYVTMEDENPIPQRERRDPDARPRLAR